MQTVVENRNEGATLPTWIIAPILAGLVGFSGLLALFVWLVMTPAGRVEPESFPVAATPIAAPPVVSVETKPSSRVDEREYEEKPMRLPTVQLQRRLPSFVESPGPVPMPMPETPVAAMEPGLPAPFRWIKEAPASSSNLLMPIEVAKIDDGVLPYRLRRLRFPDEAAQRLRLAVTPVGHDDLGRLLTKMGDGYRFTSLRRQDLLSPASLQKYDVVFLTCTDLYAEDFQAALPLRRFVAQGGTLYASDLYGDLVLAAFPEFRARVAMTPGIAQTIEARVAEPGLETYLGKKAIPLRFDAPDWRPAAFDPAKVTVCLRGIYRSNLGHALPTPLLVKFRFQKGTVIFTSFHHTKNDSEIVKKVLDYLIFSTVNARGESRVHDLMRRAGFAPTGLRPALLNADRIAESIHQHPGGDLQIALGFEHLGAKLKLTLRSPSGQIVEHEDLGVYLIEIPAAEPGRWRCTVTPITLPYANFPIIVAVGASKSQAQNP